MKISAIYSQAFKVIKQNKILWVFGLAVAAATAGGSAGAGNSFSRLGNLGGPSESSLSATAKQEFESVLIQILNVLATVPLSTWLILAVSALLAAIIALTLTVLIRSWAVGALIGGTFDALDERNQVSFATIGDRGLRSFKGLTGLYLVPPLIMALVFSPLLAVAVLLLSNQQIIIGTPLIVLTILGFGLSGLVINIATLWAERLIAIDGRPWLPAFWEGLRFFQAHFGDTYKLGLSNTLLGCGLGCGTMLLIGPVIGLLVIIGLIPIVGWVLIPILIPLVILILLFSVLINALILTFKYITWSVLYKELKV